MKKLLQAFALLLTITGSTTVVAQGQTVTPPAFTYPGPQNYAVGTSIAVLKPVNTGGAIPAVFYGQTSTLATGFTNFFGIVTDSARNVYITNTYGNLIKKVTPAGVVSVFAGNGNPGFINGTGTAASFNSPTGLAIDASGNLYVTEAGNHAIRKISPYGVVTTVAGNGTAGATNGTSTAAKFNNPGGIAIDNNGNLYVSDVNNSLIRKITPAGVVSTFAGNGTYGYKDGAGTVANFANPVGITVDVTGNLFVVDGGNNVIRKITPNGVVSTLAGNPVSPGSTNGTGTAASFNSPQGIAIDRSGNLYVADYNNSLIRMITPASVVSTLAGGASGSIDGIGSTAGFQSPSGISIDKSGSLYVTEYGSIRKVSPVGYTVNPALPAGLNFDITTGEISGTPLLAKTAANYVITARNAAGSGSATINITTSGTLPIPAPAISAPVITYGGAKTYTVGTTVSDLLPTNTGGAVPVTPYAQTTTLATGFGDSYGVVADAGGNIYYADNSYNVIRKVSPAGVTSIFAGSSSRGKTNGIGTAASFNNPQRMAIDAAGNIYVADMGNNLIRKITQDGVVTTFAGTGVAGRSDGAASTASFNGPAGIAIDLYGNFYVSDYNSHLIRKITSSGIVTTLAGSGAGGYTNGSGLAASFNNPAGIAVDALCNVYVADLNNYVIRKITPAGVVTTLAGTANSAGAVNGPGSTASFNVPESVVIDAAGNLYVADLYNHLVRKVTPTGVVSTLAGGGYGSNDGTGTAAGINYPEGITIDASGNLYVADGGNLRKITTGGYAINLALPAGLTFDNTTGVISGTPLAAKAASNYSISAYNLGGSSTATVSITVTGTLTAPALPVQAPVIAYAGPQSYTAGTAISNLAPTNTGGTVPVFSYGQTTTFLTGLGNAYGIVTDAAGNIYFSDASSNVIRKITPAGVSNIFAGSGTAGFVNGTGTAASFRNPQRMGIDAAGNIYLADAGNNVIRKITPGGVVSTFAGSGVAGRNDGTATVASFDNVSGIAVDRFGYVYASDFNSALIRKISPAGIVTTLAGSGSGGYTDGTGAAASFNGPAALAVDGLCNVYVAELYNNIIRKITPAGVVTTLAGTPGTSGATNGTGSAASFYNPQSIAIDPVGNIYVADEYNYRIRKVTPAGVVTTLAGSGTGVTSDGIGLAARFGDPTGIGIDASGQLYVADGGLIRKVSAVGYVISSAALPAGLSFDGTTGIVAGTPLLAKAAASYTISAYNMGGSSTASVSIAVTGTLTAPAAINAPVIAYSGPQTYNVGNVISSLSPSNTGGAVPATIYGTTTTFAGTGATGINDGLTTAATFNHPSNTAADLYGNIYVADYDNHVIRKISATGIVTTLAGSGVASYADGTGTAASFYYPSGVAVDVSGTVYVADSYNQVIRKITPAGVVTTLAGTANSPGYADGTGAGASFNYPNNVAVDASKNVYVSDGNNAVIRKITPAGVVTTLAGNAGNAGYADGTGTAAMFNNPNGIAVDASGIVYVSDYSNNAIRKITAAGVVTTFAGSPSSTGYNDGTGTAAGFSSPGGLTVDKAGNLYVADISNNLIRKITKTGVVSTLAGNNATGFTNGTGAAATFYNPWGVAADYLGNVYVSDRNNNVIRKITATGYTTDNALPAGLILDGTTGTISGKPTNPLAATVYSITAYNGGGSSTATVSITVNGTATATPVVAAPQIAYATPKSYPVGAAISTLSPTNTGGAVPAFIYGQTTTLANTGYYSKGIAFDKSGNAYISYQNKILAITPAGVVSTFAGNETSGAVNGKGSAASFYGPQGLCFDASGNLYVADNGNQLIRKISPSGVVTNFAGVVGVTGAKNGAANTATFYNPQQLAIDVPGNVYITDGANNMIRKITTAGVVSTLAGNVNAGYIDGTGTAASFNNPYGITVDASGNLYVADQNNSLIRKITAAGVVTTLAGNPVNTGNTNGTGSAASFSAPSGLAMDVLGNIYVADQNNSLIRKVTPGGVVTTLAGNGTTGSTNGVGITSSFYYPLSVAFDGSGNLYLTDYNNAVRKISLNGYALAGTLPAGLVFDGTTGAISGTPVLASAATNYSVTAYNAGGSSATTVNIAVTGTVTPPVNPVNAPVISYATPQSYTAGVGISTLNPSNAGGAVPATIYGRTTDFVTGSYYSHGLVTDASGNVYFTASNQIIKATPAGVTSVLAGNNNAGSVNSTGTAASFNNPQGLGIDAAGNIYVADASNNMIRKVTPAGVVSTFAGSTISGSNDGPGASASFNGPQGVTVDLYGNVYITDYGNNLIRKISATGIVTTLAGNSSGYADGTGTAASFSNPYGITVNASGTLYVSDQGNALIRKITPSGVVTTLAGSAGNGGATNGTGTAASFSNPSGLAIDAVGNIYVADQNNSLIRKVTPAGVVTTLAGNGTTGSINGVGVTSSFYYPLSVAVDGSGNLYETDYNNTVRKISLNGYTLTGSLPSGLTFDGTTGAIAGTPVVSSPATNYSVTAYNTGGSSTTTVNIAVTGTVTPPVNPVNAPVISYATPQSYAAGVGISTLSPSNTGGAVPAMIYAQTNDFVTGSNYSRGVITDASGNVYYTVNNQVIKVTPAGITNVLAGNGNAGFINDTGTAASFNSPQGLGIDAAGNIYVADATNNVIRKITPAGVVSTFAGTGVYGRNDGPGTLATFNAPQAVVVDLYGNVYVTDAGNNLIRKIGASGIVSTLAGNTSPGYANGTGAAASFSTPLGITIDASGNLYVSDQGNQVIRKITPAGVVTTLAGSAGNAGATNGTGSAASFNTPSGLTIDAVGNIYVADQNNSLIRKVTPTGVVTTLAGNGTTGTTNGIGTAASFYYPLSLAIDGSGNLYETDYNNTVRKISLNGYTLTGVLPAGLTFDGTTGSIVGTPLTAAAAKNYTVTAYNSGGSSTATLSIAVTGTAVAPTAPTVPVISYATPQTYAVGIPIAALAPVNTGGAVPPFIYGITGPFAGTGINGSGGGIGATASFNGIAGIATDIYGNIYTADAGGYNIRRITPGGFVTTFAGNGSPGFTNGTGTAASFSTITGITVDANSNVYVTDQGNQVIRKITPAGVVSTFSGNGSYGAVNGSATVAGFANPLAITADKSGILYVVDNGNVVIRKITAAGTVSTFAGNASGGFSNGTGTAASFSTIRGIATDVSGNVYVTDFYNNAIRKITTAGVVTTLAGNGNAGFADGTGTAARFSNPVGITVDAGGNIYVGDQGNSIIRKITPAGVVTTIAGDGNQTKTDGIGQAASFTDPTYLSVENSGNLYVVDDGNTIRKISINGYTNSAPLSSGLNFDGTTGVISGTPTAVSAATTYTIKGNNSAGTGTANVSITVIYPPVVTTTAPVTAFASMGDVTPVPVVIDGGITVTDLSKTVLASATVSVTGNFVASQDVLAFTPNAATMGNIAATYNAATGVLSLTSASSTATLAQWQAALQSVTYNNSNNVAPNVASRTISFVANDGQFNSAVATKTIGLTYTPSSNAKLSNLSISAGTLSPAFASLTNNYTATVSNTVSSITVVPVTASANATLTVNGNILLSGATSAAIPLNVGDNTITTVVTAQDQTTILTYTVVVTRNAAQVITFNPIAATTYGTADFAPGATSTNSTIPITYTSSNTAVATIVSGNIHIVGLGTTNITASQAAGPNFDAATPVVVPLTVNQAALTITASNQSKSYGSANPTLTVSYAGFVNGDTQAVLTTLPTTSTTATTASGVGSYPITASGAVAANYTITYAPGILTVSPVALSVTANNQTKTYGDINPVLTLAYSGFVNGDTQAAAFTTLPSASTGALTSSGVGTYPINVSGGISTNYTVNYTSGVLTIGKAGLLITADNQTKAYGTANPTLTASYTGFVNADNAANLLTPPVLSTTATTTSGVGSYPITLSGATSNNYNITYQQGTLTITGGALAFDPIPAKVYGATDFAPGATSSASISYTSSNPAVATIVAGNVHVVGTGTSTITANNGTSTSSQTLSVSPAALTITANNQTKASGADNPVLTLSYSGFVNGDTQSVLTTQPTVTTTATANSAAGSYPITASGAVAANYNISYVAGTLTVTSAPLAFAAIPSKVYGTADFNPGATGGSSITYTSSNAAVATIVAGNIHIVGKGSSTIKATSGSSNISQTLTVTAAPLTITAVSQTKVAGTENPTLTASYSGFVNSETSAVLTTLPKLATTATTASAVGNYPITISGAVAANYAITYVAGRLTVTAATLTFAAIPAKTYGTADFSPGATSGAAITYTSSNTSVATIVSGNIHVVGAGTSTITATSGSSTLTQTLTVNPTALTVVAQNQTKTYGAVNPLLTASYTGFVNGDTTTSLATQPSVTTTGTVASGVGSYPITVSGGVSNNYTITYTNGTLTVGKAALTITADDKTKSGGAANPALTVTYNGFVNGDTEAVLTTPATITTTATTASVVGTYPITVSGAVAANYDISFVAGTLTVSTLVAPDISYTSPQNYSSGTAITALVPVNAGGAVPNAIFGQTTTFAGSITAGSVNGTGTAARFNNPGGIAFDKSGNVYVAETNANLIRKITTAGVVTTFAGSGTAATVNGTGTAASFNRPSGIVADANGNFYVTDAGSYRIRKITSTGVVSTFAGSGVSGTTDGQGTAAKFSYPEQIAIDASGNLYVADANTAIRKITPAGLVSTLPYTFQSPFGVAVDKNGSIYVSDFSNQIFRIGADGKTVFAGNGAVGAANGTGAAATFNNPNFIAVDALGNVYVADSSNGLVRKITPAGVVTTLAGSGSPGNANGTGTAASFNFPFGIAVDASGNVFTTDANQVRKIIATGYGISPALSPGLVINGSGTISGTPSSGTPATDYAVTAYNTAGSSTANINITISGQNTFQVPVISYAGPQTYPAGTAITALTPVNTGGVVPAITYGNTTTLGTTVFNEPRGVVADASGNVYVAEQNNQLIRKITTAGVVSVFAGSGETGSTDGTGTAASFDGPKGIAIDASGNLYVTETGSNIIRKITSAGVVTTLAGNGTYGATNGTGTAASFAGPKGAAVDGNGNVYVADEANNMIRKITPAGVVTTFAGSGAMGSANGYGTAATFNGVIGIAIDASGNLFVTDEVLIRKITPTGLVSTFAGNGNSVAVDGIGTAASFGGLEGITIDKSGNLYVADDDQVRMITPAGVVTTIAGDGNGDGAPTNGVGTAASFSNIYGVTADKLGNVYVGDTDNGLVRKITVTGYTVSPALPAGLKLDGKTGAISGTPTVASAASNYVITAYNKNGSGSANLSIAVTQPLKFVAIPAVTYGAADFNPGATGGNNPATYTSSNTAVATIVSGQIHVTGAGTSTITASDGTSSLTQTLTVNKAALSIAAANKTKTAGSANPALTVTYTGFVNGDTEATLTTQATVSTAATTASAAGSYSIIASGAVSANYTITYVAGVLTVTSPPVAAPVIAYSAQTYTRGVAITALVPANSGGAVPATNFAQVTTLAGSLTRGATNGTGSAATFNGLMGVATDNAGNIYAADANNNLIRKITPSGVVTTFAGNGLANYADGPAASASFYGPLAVATDLSNNVYVADLGNHLVRKITTGGVVSTLAAGFDYPSGITTDALGNIYVAERQLNLIKKITPSGVVTTFAGNGTSAAVDGPALATGFNQPTGIASDAAGNIYVSDNNNNLIRKITPAGTISSIAGIVLPFGVTVDAAGNMFVTDYTGAKIKKVTPAGVITTLAGTGSLGNTDGIGTAASFNYPLGITIDRSGNLYMTDNGTNQSIRKIVTTGYTISPALPAGLAFNTTTGVISGTPTAVSAATTYTVTAYNAGGSSVTTFSLTVKEPAASTGAPVISYAGPQAYTVGTAIASLAPTNTGGPIPNAVYGQVTTFAGSTTSGILNGVGTNARFNGPLSVANDAAGNVYVADQINSRIRKITPAGSVTVFAGSGTQGTLDGTGTAARFNRPTGLAVDAAGNVYVADQSNNLIRKISSAGVVTTFAGSGTSGNVDGAGTAASFNLPTHIAIDKQGNLYVTDLLNSLIRKITPAGVVSTFAGSGVQGSANGTGTAASFNYPTGIAVDANGVLYVADQNNNKIRKITAAGVVTTFAGSGTAGAVNGTSTAASFYNPYDVAVDGTGNVYVADYNNNLIRLINSAGTVTTLAGKTASGAVDGTGTAASFNHPGGLSLDGAGNLYVADYSNNEIRKINVTGYTINATLPAGLTFAPGTGIISGTPTAVKATLVYTIIGYNAVGSGKGTVSITVSADTASAGKKLAVSYVDSGLPTEPKVKQAMSPNGDGINDVLQIENIENYPDNKVVLIDVNGISIFEVSGYDNANKVFNGHSNKTGTMQRAGTYYYVLEYRDKGELKRKTGYFIIKY